jgi:hypothetical protein
MDTTTTTLRPPSPPPFAPATAARLAELLDAELAFSPSARDGFVNHLAMGLVAAARLGAGPDELAAAYDEQAASDFLRRREEPAWLAPEAAAVVDVGVAEAVRARGSELAVAPAARWFHAAIRLEHAVDAGHPGQVANAIHDWADHGEPLAPLFLPAGPRSYAEVVERLVDAAVAEAAPAGGRPANDLGAAARQPWFEAGMGELRRGPDLLDEVAAVALAAHVAGGSIGTLHLVTGTRAARALAPLLDPADGEELAARTAQAVAAGVVATLASPLPDRRQLDAHRAAPGASWGEVAEAARATGDPHVIKLTWAARQEHAATGDELYRWVAAREAGLG